MTTLTHTQQQILLSVNVITKSDNGLQFAVLPLISLSWLVMAVWRLRLNVYRAELWLKSTHKRLWRVCEQISERLSIASKLLTIGFNSLAWGLL